VNSENEQQDSPSDPLIITLTFNEPTNMLGWNLVPQPGEETSEAEGFGTVRTKEYAENTVEEVSFFDVLGNQGKIKIVVSQIILPTPDHPSPSTSN
jgi:hypothetical protein